MKYLLLTLSVLAAGCSHKEQVVTPDVYSGAYLEDFKADAAASGTPVNITDLIVRFGDPAADGCSDAGIGLLVGCCSLQTNQSPTITLLKSEWDVMWDVERKELLYHELGHCILHRVHRDDLNPDGYACSLMISPLPGYLPGYWSLGHDTEYILELFGVGPGPGC